LIRTGIPVLRTAAAAGATDAGFPLTAGQMISESLVDSLIVSGNEDTVAIQFTELLAAGLDELMVTLVPIKDAADEFMRLMRLIGQL
jgi:hypothetical protein